MFMFTVLIMSNEFELNEQFDENNKKKRKKSLIIRVKKKFRSKKLGTKKKYAKVQKGHIDCGIRDLCQELIV